MSFSFVIMAYCVAPLPLSRQVPLALAYAAGVLLVSRHADETILGTVAVAYAAATFFGAVTSWQLIGHSRARVRRGIWLPGSGSRGGVPGGEAELLRGDWIPVTVADGGQA